MKGIKTINRLILILLFLSLMSSCYTSPPSKIYYIEDEFTDRKIYATSSFQLNKRRHYPSATFNFSKEKDEYTIFVTTELSEIYKGPMIEKGNEIIILLNNREKIAAPCIETKEPKRSYAEDEFDLDITKLYAFYLLKPEDLEKIGKFGIRGIRIYLNNGEYFEDFAADEQYEMRKILSDFIFIKQ